MNLYRLFVLIACIFLSLNHIKADQGNPNTNDSFVLAINLPGNGITINWSEGHVYKIEQGEVIYIQRFEIFSEEAYVKLPKNKEILTYRILYEPRTGKYFDILMPEKDTLNVSLDVFNPELKPIFANGSSLHYQSFLAQYDSFYNVALSQFNYITNTNEDQKEDARKMLKKLNKAYKKESKILKKGFKNAPKNSPIKLLSNNTPVLLFNPKHNEDQHLEFWLKHFWKNVDSQNPLLANSFLYPMLIERFLMPFFENFETSENLNYLYRAIDQVMLHLGATPTGYNLAYQFMFEGFQTIENNDLLFYLSGNYDEGETCSTPDKTTVLNKSNHLNKGFKSPDFEFTSWTTNEVTSLYEWEYDTVLLVFWSATCPHCMNALPILYNKLGSDSKNKNLYGVVSISVDSDPKLYSRYRGHYPNWSHYNDFKGWDSPILQAYFVDATPTFIVLDKERKVIKKTHSVEQALHTLIPKNQAR